MNECAITMAVFDANKFFFNWGTNSSQRFFTESGYGKQTIFWASLTMIKGMQFSLLALSHGSSWGGGEENCCCIIRKKHFIPINIHF